MTLRSARTLVWRLALFTGVIAAACAIAVLTTGSPDEAKPMDTQVGKIRVLILCTGNSCRSQFAEALWRQEAGNRYEVASAGTAPKGVNPLTIQVLKEIGIPTAGLRSKHVDELDLNSFDLIVTVCDHAKETCPVIPAKCQHLHWPFDDPPAAKGSEEEVLAMFRRVRDEIRAQIQTYVTGGAAANR